MDRRKFIGSCACCAFASAGAVFLNKNKPIKKQNDNSFTIRHVEIHIAEHCNLNCKYCSHFSPIAEKEFYDLDKFKQDMAQMSYVFDKKLGELQLLGGEPLLNPNVNEYVKISREFFPKSDIGITTNAILLDNMNESFWKTLNEYNVALLPTVYPIKINWKSILDKAKKYNVEVYANRDPGQTEKLTTDNIKKYRKNTFYQMKLDENSKKDFRNINCEKKFVCMGMFEGRLYPCIVILHIRHLNKKYGTKFVVSKNDYLDLYKVRSYSEVEKFVKTAQVPFCRYCGRSPRVKWESSVEHNINEWIQNST